MYDLEIKLKEQSPKHGVEFWFIDWVRHPFGENKIQAQRIYEWLHSNKEWLYKTD